MDGIQLTGQQLWLRFALFLPKLITSLVVFVVTLLLAAMAQRGTHRLLQRRKETERLAGVISHIVRWAVIVMGCVVALQQVNFDVTAFVAGLGILGFTIGFGLQDVSKNFVAGLILLLQHPFNIGEAIEIGGFTGTVVMVNLRATVLRTFDGRQVHVPNANVLTSPIVNLSREIRRRLDLDVGVSGNSDLELVTRVAVGGTGQNPRGTRRPRAARGVQGIRVVDHRPGTLLLDQR